MSTDLIIALGLIGIVIIIFIVYRLGVLPKKSIPFILAAVAAVCGWSWFQNYRLRSLKKELEKREEDLRIQEQRLEELKKNFEITEEQLQTAQHELDQQRSAYKKVMLKIDAEKTKGIEEIENLSGDELDAAFDDLLKRLGRVKD
jgi:septal ring factor EnvC (AmiA/AmiB activator)